jgi:hypothetical protein
MDRHVWNFEAFPMKHRADKTDLMNSQKPCNNSSSCEGSVVSREISRGTPGGRPLTPSNLEVVVLAAHAEQS